MKVLIFIFVLSIGAALEPSLYQSNTTCTYEGNCNGRHGAFGTNLPIIDLQNTHGDSITKRFFCAIIC